jgi:Uma2 family endonuclease
MLNSPVLTITPEPTAEKPLQLPAGNIIALNVSEAEYMAKYAADFCEWIDGKVIAMPPVMEDHDSLNRFLIMLLGAYFAYQPIGELRQAPFVMKLERSREPDIQIILKAHQERLKPSYVDGAADICIEIVSEESITRDYGEKLLEYEKGGVQEYWLIDPEREDTRFYRLDANGKYRAQALDADANYHSQLLPKFTLQTLLLWRKPLPNFIEIGLLMAKMLEEK